MVSHILVVFLALCLVLAVLSGVQSSVVDGQPCKFLLDKTTLGKCNEHCICLSSGKWQCCRLRKDYTEMTLDEVNLFNSALLKARYDPRLRALYDEMVLKHEELAAKIHTWPYFLPWHRYWLVRFETAVRQVIDCRIAVPYFDFTRHWRTWWQHSPFDHQHLGGNGQGKNCCVADGPFREGHWNVTAVKASEGGCLKRYFNKSALMPSPRVMSILLGTFEASQLKAVASVLNHWVHNAIHNSVGGYFFLYQAANDPVFWVVHSYIDKMWSTWQQRGILFRKQPYVDMTDIPMPGTPHGVKHSLADFYDMENLPGKVRVCYTKGMSLAESISEEDFVGPSIPRSSLKNLKGWQVERLVRKLDKDELAQLNYIVGLMSGAIKITRLYHRLPGDCVRDEATF